ncbi:IS1595 family transposase [Marinospirillum minutulum]|uniref:IS1595 family transposase n=1 Tax=Marinospirillum minutulum TaxID=64974 RepID=UPI003CCBFA81
MYPKCEVISQVQRSSRGNHDNLMPFIKVSITPEFLIHTDGSPAYRQIKENGYEHRQTVHLRSTTPAHESMPGVHRVASLLQRWMMGTHHGAVQPRQLDNYLNEYVFRFNRRKSKSRSLLFYRLLQQAVVTK